MEPQERPFDPVVVVPTYNNAEAVVGVLHRIEALGLPIIVVNDGSTDETARLLADWSTESKTPARVLTHGVNQGKATAMLTGFRAASEAGHSHAATIDSDGQLDPGEMPALIDAARTNADALVLGTRSTAIENYPIGSRIGRAWSNLAIFLECGKRVHDSQCGLRVYPLRLIEAIRCRAGRFGWEAEVITRGVWAGFDVVQVPVTVRYLPRGQHKSHFRTWVDTRRGLALHARLLGRAMLPWAHRDVVGAARKQALSTGSGWRRFFRWINPLRAWRAIFDPAHSRGELSSGFAVGVFVANLPIYPFQSAVALYAAHRLHLHPAVVFAGSTVSTPPVGIALVAAAIGLGHVLLTGRFPSAADYDLKQLELWTVAARTLLEWAVGAVIVGVVTAGTAFLAAYIAIGVARRPR